MKLHINGHNLHLKEQFHDRVEHKLAKFHRYFGDDSETWVKARHEGARDFCVEITMKVKRHYYRAEETASDLLQAFDACLDHLERQIRQQKTHIERYHREYAYLKPFLQQELLQGEDLSEEDEKSEFDIGKKKSFPIDMMTPEEAVLQMELLGHNFLLFLHDKTGKVALVYRRKNKGYGFIEPEY